MATSYQVKPPVCKVNWASRHARGLVGAWPAQREYGTALRDAAGHNDGALNGFNFNSASGWGTGPYGPHLLFDGVNDYVSMSPATLPQGAAARTIVFWLRDDGTPTANQSVLDYGAIGTGTRWSISVDSGEFSVAVGNYRIGLAGLTTTDWHRYAVVFPPGATLSSQVLFYQDGRSLSPSNLGGTGAVTVNTGNTYANIGSDKGQGAADYQKGALSDLRIYNRALSGTDLLDSFLNPWHLYGVRRSVSLFRVVSGLLLARRRRMAA